MTSTFRSTDLEIQANPVEFFAWIRANSPVYRDPDTGVYFITRDEDIRQVAMDADTFSNVIDPSVFRVVLGKALEQSDPEVANILKTRGWLLPNTLLMIDPPDHLRYRRLAQEALSPKSVTALSKSIGERADQLIESFPPDGAIDFVEDYAKLLPIWVIGTFMFGAPESDFRQINDWADQFFSTLMPAAPRDEYLKTVDQMIDMHHYIKGRIDRFRTAPDNSVLLSRLLTVHEASGDAPLSDEELISMMQVVLIAGHDTTRQTISSSMLELARHPDLVSRLKADNALIPSFINEVLRLHPAANVTTRISTRDTEVGGVTIPKGAMVFVAWGSGNRDEKVHPDGDKFDIDRNDKTAHLSFGWGLHHCVGANLARAQVRITLERILKRFHRIELLVGEDELTYLPSMNTRSLMALPLRLS